jgi:hypothetical protein
VRKEKDTTMAELLLETKKCASITEALLKLQKCMDDTHAELTKDCDDWKSRFDTKDKHF